MASEGKLGAILLLVFVMVGVMAFAGNYIGAGMIKTAAGVQAFGSATQGGFQALWYAFTYIITHGDTILLVGGMLIAIALLFRYTWDQLERDKKSRALLMLFVIIGLILYTFGTVSSANNLAVMSAVPVFGVVDILEDASFAYKMVANNIVGSVNSLILLGVSLIVAWSSWDWLKENIFDKLSK